MIKLKLLPWWRSAWRLWSVRLAAIGTVLSGWLAIFPNAAVDAWNILPAEMKTLLPVNYVQWISATVMLLTIYARLVHQPKATEVIETKMVEKQLTQEPPNNG